MGKPEKVNLIKKIIYRKCTTSPVEQSEQYDFISSKHSEEVADKGNMKHKDNNTRKKM